VRSEEVVVDTLKAALLGLCLCLGMPASATTDCSPMRSVDLKTAQYLAIVYVNPTELGNDAGAERKFKKDVERTLIDDYMSNMLKLGHPSPYKLTLLNCMKDKQPTTLRTQSDIDELKLSKVAIAVWRSVESGMPIVSHAVVGHLLRTAPSDTSDGYIEFTDESPVTDTAQRWSEPTPQNLAAMQSLIGLGLGMIYLDKGDAFGAKLALCKSRNDMKRAAASRLRPPKDVSDINAFIQTLIGEAEQKIKATALRADAALLASISSACGL
jgi:hypothetical protein